MGRPPIPRAEINRGYIASPHDRKEGVAVVRASMSHDSACNSAQRPAMMVNWYYRLAGLSLFAILVTAKDLVSGQTRVQAADSGVRADRRPAEAVDADPSSCSAFTI